MKQIPVPTMTTPVTANRVSTFYLCYGHPEWPDGVRKDYYEDAINWFTEWRHEHSVHVVEIVEQRRLLRDSSKLHEPKSEDPSA